MQRIVEQAVELIPAAEGSAVELVLGEQLVYACAAGSLTSFVGIRLSLASSLSGLAVGSGETLRCDNSEVDPRADREACRRVGTVSMICVPLRRGDVPVGVLKVSARVPGAFDEHDVDTLTRLAGFITTAITTIRALSEAAAELFVDPEQLTDTSRANLEAMSAFVANVVLPGVTDEVEATERVRDVLERGLFTMVLQPVIDLNTMHLVGAEALARFHTEPHRTPDVWFAEAHRVGLGTRLQLAALRQGLKAAEVLPSDAFVALNLDGEALAHPDLGEMLRNEAHCPVVLELTEHLEVDDYCELRRLLSALRQNGTRLAIDDTGAGYSSFSHIIKLAPDLIKLDIELVRGIDVDPVRRSLVTAVVAFAAETGAEVLAEGIETDAELRTIRDLSVRYGQGYLLGAPVPPDDFEALISARARSAH